jgi:hypothetical protein
MSIDIEDRTRHDLLYRLRWNLLDSAEHIEIATGPLDQIINLPFLGHPLANESLFNPPLSCIDEITIRDFADKEDQDIYYPKEERYKPPTALKITNSDGSPITLGQFVTELHTYVEDNLEELKKVKGEMYGEHVTHADGSYGRNITAGRPVVLPNDVGIFFYTVMPIDRDGSIRLLVRLYAEGEFYWPKGFWAMRLLQVHNREIQQ